MRSTAASMPDPAAAIRTGIRVEWLTVAWMILEAAVSLGAGIAVGSIALVAFGADSVVELISGATLLWRLRVQSTGSHDAGETAERVERAERLAGRVVGVCLFALAAYVVVQSAYNLWARAASRPSPVGIAVAAAAVIVMPVLAATKRRIAALIDSPALRGDAACGTVCAYMAATLLAGLLLRAAFGWWWADPVAALGIVYFIVREGRETLLAEDGHCGSG
jgi:divalent metal cation (Fe/Co/Zn/Cd) transporter